MTTIAGEPIHVVCASDEQYAMPLCACLASAIHFLDPTIELHVSLLDAGIQDKTKTKLRRSLEALARGRLELTFVDISAAREIRSYSASQHVNWVTLSKLMLPRLLPNTRKAIWLDCDLIVCDSLLELWQTPMHGKSILAVRESTVGRNLPFAEDYGVALDAPYFNAGVMVLDLDSLRRNDLTSRALTFLARHPKLNYLDQDVLNIVAADDWAQLDPRWNFIVAHHPEIMASIEQAHLRPHPSIVHYASVPKPWHWNYGYQRLYSSYFYYALDLTEWRGWRPPIGARQVIRSRWPTLSTSLRRLRERVNRLL